MSDSPRRNLPRRDLVPLWVSGFWLYPAFWFAVFAVFAPTPLVTATLAAVAAPLAATGIWRYAHARRNAAASAHRELLAVLRSLPAGGVWLNRDERAAFTYRVKGRLPLLRLVTVIRVPEDDILTLHREGSTHLVVDTWQVAPWEYGIQHSMHGATVTDDSIGDGTVTFPRTGFWRWQKNQRAARKAGMLHIAADETRALIRALRDAEPVQPDGGGNG